MNRDLFIDTSAWYALTVARDPNNAPAKIFFAGAFDQYRHLISTNHVIGEAYTLMRHRWGYNAARGFLENARNSRRLKIVFLSEKQESYTYEFLAGYPQHDLSFVDGASMVVMKAQMISDCFTFDRRFAAVGFQCWP